MSYVLCPICGHDCGTPFLSRLGVPVFLNRVYRNRDEARRATTGRLDLAYCQYCSFGFNVAFDPSLVAYGPDYENEQCHSPEFVRHLDEMIDRVRSSLQGSAGSVVEVGCGQGDFLRRLAAGVHGDAIEFVGVDPCYRARGLQREGLRFFTSTLEEGPADMRPSGPLVMLSRHVIEHVPRPVEFLTSMLKEPKQTVRDRLFLETPSFEWIIRNRMFMDLFYEHCSYFTRKALHATATKAGWDVESIDTVFGGQYYWLKARAAFAGQNLAWVHDEPSLTYAEIESFQAREVAMRAYWQKRLDQMAERGPVAVWGAAAKGVTFATQLDPESRRIKCLIDLNPAKQDRFIPISGHPVRSMKSAVEDGIAAAFVMNPNYLDEIKQMTCGLQIELIPVQATDHALHL